METKKIIPCLDVKDERVVKGVSFVNLRDAGDAVENAVFYESEGADELAFLDLSAALDNKPSNIDLIKRITEKIKIPLTVGGGIRSAEDAKKIIDAGASKISINSAAIANLNLIADCVKAIGKGRITVAIDAKKTSDNKGWTVYSSGGSKDSKKDVLEWARETEALGASEILLTSIDCDGAKNGYDIELTSAVATAVKIPVIASGGAGKKEDFLKVLTDGKASKALAASLFHFREVEIRPLKQYLKDNGVKVIV